MKFQKIEASKFHSIIIINHILLYIYISRFNIVILHKYLIVIVTIMEFSGCAPLATPRQLQYIIATIPPYPSLCPYLTHPDEKNSVQSSSQSSIGIF